MLVAVMVAGGLVGYSLSRPATRPAPQSQAAHLPGTGSRGAGGKKAGRGTSSKASTGPVKKVTSRTAGRTDGRASQRPVGHAVTGATAHSFVPPARTLLATTHGTIPKFAYPGGPQDGHVPGTWHDGKSTLPVIARRPGWLDVRLAQRPNESTAWVLARDVSLSVTPYAVVIDLASTHLQLYRRARSILSAPVGVGTTQYPTPPGTYFAAFFAAPPNPGYGAFVIVTSAHSNVITDWDMSGDAMVAIHGPLGSDAEIGTTGARISHGCIRMHEDDLVRLRRVPAGSPIYILSS